MSLYWANRAASLAKTATENDPAIAAYALVSIALSLAEHFPAQPPDTDNGNEVLASAFQFALRQIEADSLKLMALRAVAQKAEALISFRGTDAEQERRLLWDLQQEIVALHSVQVAELNATEGGSK